MTKQGSQLLQETILRIVGICPGESPRIYCQKTTQIDLVIGKLQQP